MNNDKTNSLVVHAHSSDPLPESTQLTCGRRGRSGKSSRARFVASAGAGDAPSVLTEFARAAGCAVKLRQHLWVWSDHCGMVSDLSPRKRDQTWRLASTGLSAGPCSPPPGHPARPPVPPRDQPAPVAIHRSVRRLLVSGGSTLRAERRKYGSSKIPASTVSICWSALARGGTTGQCLSHRPAAASGRLISNGVILLILMFSAASSHLSGNQIAVCWFSP